MVEEELKKDDFIFGRHPVLEATHAVTLHVVALDDLKKYAVKLQ